VAGEIRYPVIIKAVAGGGGRDADRLLRRGYDGHRSIRTSVPLHLRILAGPDFGSARLSTSFLDSFIASRPQAHAATVRAVP
jgi:biotin carboxylase